jgi:poly[(R)-3-hydroxyalkanoate] polymerase subunit PhaC
MIPEVEYHDRVTEEARPRDALLNAAVARATMGISPNAVALAYLDWASHLASSPGKQQELAQKAWRKMLRMALYAAGAASESQQCIEPLPQDRRFDHPSWQRWPFNLIYQSFLLAQQWCWNATTGVHGVTGHHEEVVTFVTRQWLDMFSPSNFLFTNPEVLEHTWHSAGMNLLRGAQNLWQDLLRQMSNRPPAGAEQFRVGENVATTPGKVIFRNRLIELIQYAPRTGTVRPEPILIVPSWIMKYYILDLSPGNSLVRYLVENGYTVFVISWKNPGSEDRDLGMEAYLHTGVFAALSAISRVLSAPRVHGLGYCLGGTLLAIAAALAARDGDAKFASVSLLAAELDFSEPGELGLFIDESQIAFIEDIMWMRGYLDGKELAGAFTLLNSKDLLWSKMVREYLMGERAPLSDLMAWNADATRLPLNMHSEYLRKLYLANDLAEGRYEVDGRAVALTDIRVPMFIVGTERDHISPWRSVYRAHLLTDAELTFVLSTGGHNVGVVNPPGAVLSGRGYRHQTRKHDAMYQDPDLWCVQAERCEGSWWPQFLAWLDERSGERVNPPSLGAAQAGLPPLCDAPGRYVLAP